MNNITELVVLTVRTFLTHYVQHLQHVGPHVKGCSLRRPHMIILWRKTT
jgi:hypothetical protein